MQLTSAQPRDGAGVALSPVKRLASAERLARLRLIRSDGIGPRTYHGLMQRFPSATDVIAQLPDLARQAGRKGVRLAAEGAVAQEVRDLERLGGRLLILGDDDYPTALAAIPDAPPVLSVLGDVALLSAPSLAIVGARNASTNGRAICRSLAGEIGAEGIVVVSGLARGIDAEAHAAALSTGTVAVVAGGIDRVYPPENAALRQQIIDGGVLVAEGPLGAEPKARDFPRRNRIIAGLARGILVIEAQMRSGSLITARLANEYGRDVYAVPGSPLDPRARGANRLIRDGARLVETAADVMDEFLPMMHRPLPVPDLAGTGPAPDLLERLTDTEQDQAEGADAGLTLPDRLLQALSMEPVDADRLMRETGLSAADFQVAILDLELSGAVVRHAGNRISLASGVTGAR